MAHIYSLLATAILTSSVCLGNESQRELNLTIEKHRQEIAGLSGSYSAENTLRKIYQNDLQKFMNHALTKAAADLPPHLFNALAKLANPRSALSIDQTEFVSDRIFLEYAELIKKIKAEKTQNMRAIIHNALSATHATTNGKTLNPIQAFGLAGPEL